MDVGFVGAGRITRIFIGGWVHEDAVPDRVVVSDISSEPLLRIQEAFPAVEVAEHASLSAGGVDVVFLAVPIRAVLGVCEEIRDALTPKTLIVSLAPKVTIGDIAERLGGFSNVARMVPNAPSIVGAGFNPISYHPDVDQQSAGAFEALVAPLGAAPMVDEAKLEAYAMVSAMGPAYFWPQFFELRRLAETFGLSREEADRAMRSMIVGAVDVMIETGWDEAEVLDLISGRPLDPLQSMIVEGYAKLASVYEAIRPKVTRS